MPFGNEVKTGNITENWLFELSYNSGTLRLSFQDYNDGSNFYYGSVLNKPFIRESIDLSSSTSSSSNITINIANFKYEGSDVSELFFGGSNYFLNKDAVIKSVINNGSAVTIGTFRTPDLQTDGNTIKISLSSKKPWDFISAPQDKNEFYDVYAPIVYGNYTPESSSVSTPNEVEDAIVFPVPIVRVLSKEFIALVHENIISNGRLHYYEKNAEGRNGESIFIPLDDANNLPISFGSLFAVKTDVDLERSAIHTPTGLQSNGAYASVTNPDNALDDNISTSFAEIEEDAFGFTYPFNSNGSINQEKSAELFWDVPALDHQVTAFKTRYYINYFMQATADRHLDDPITNVLTIRLFVSDITYGESDEIIDTFDVTGTNLTEGQTVTINRSSTALYEATKTNIDGQTPNAIKLKIRARVELTSGEVAEDSINISVRIFQVTYVSTNKIPTDDADQAQSVQESIANVEYLYCGANGFNNGITGLSGRADKIHEVHLDLLNRFAGVDVATNPSTDITGWSALDSDKNWVARYWNLRPLLLKDILEKMQYEGGFIFRYNADGSPHYIHIRDSYTDTDYEISKADIKDVDISITSFLDLLTKMTINYQKSPIVGEDKYLKTKTAFADTVRTNYGIQTKENTAEVSLDAYVSPDITEYDGSTKVDAGSVNPNDNFFSYYYNIFGDVKIIVKGTIVNPEFYNIDVGETVEFTDMYPEKAFGKSFNNVVFMITSLQRTAGILKFEAREIGAI